MMTPEVWRRVEQLFAEAVERGPVDREAWLAEQNLDDVEVRRELQRLLDAVDDARGAVSGVVAESVRALNAETPIQLPAEKRIGNYEILSEIGRGGMGIVYLARRDDDVFRKLVAIKVVKRGMDTDQVLTRFRHERRILARLDHPFIAHVLDGGSTAGDLPYLVMEYIEGSRITDFCDRKKLPLTERLELFRKICAAVEYAHQNLIIHRDLKPSNILVEDSGTPKLLDFGIAKLLDDDTEGITTLTSDGMRLLTPRHASPEQVLGEPITTASDIYSLGTILYELLTGSSAHRITGNTPPSLVRAVCTEEVIPPSVAVRDVPDAPVPARDLVGDLDNVILTALRKDPRERYGSVHQFSEDLRRYVENMPVLARPQTLFYRTGKFLRRNKAGTLAVGLLLLSLIGGTAVSTYQARRAERRFLQLRSLANTFLFDIHDQLENVPGTTPARETMVRTALQYLDGLVRESGRDERLLWELATAYQRVGDLQGYAPRPNLGHPEAALESHSKALAIAEKLFASDPSPRNRLLLTIGYHRVGYMQRTLGQTAQGLAALEKGLVLAQQLEAERPGEAEESQWLMRLHSALALLQRGVGNAQAASQHNLQALEVTRRWYAHHPDDLSRAYLATGLGKASHALQDVGDLEGAVRYARDEIAIRKELAARPNEPDTSRAALAAIEQLARVFWNPDELSLNDRPAATPYYVQVLGMAEKLAASDRTNVQAVSDLAIARRNMCEVMVVDDPRGAAEQCLQGLELSTQAASIRNEIGAKLLAGAAQAHRRMRNLHSALDYLQRAIDAQEKAVALDVAAVDLRKTLLRMHLEMGLLQEELGNRTKALDSHRRALAIVEGLLSNVPDDPLVHHDLADCYEAIGHYFEGHDWVQARDSYQKSFDIWSSWTRYAKSTSMDVARRKQASEALARASEALKNAN